MLKLKTTPIPWLTRSGLQSFAANWKNSYKTYVVITDTIIYYFPWFFCVGYFDINEKKFYLLVTFLPGLFCPLHLLHYHFYLFNNLPLVFSPIFSVSHFYYPSLSFFLWFSLTDSPFSVSFFLILCLSPSLSFSVFSLSLSLSLPLSIPLSLYFLVLLLYILIFYPFLIAPLSIPISISSIFVVDHQQSSVELQEVPTVSDTIIATIKMRKNFWYPLKMVIFLILRSNIGHFSSASHLVIAFTTIAKVVALNLFAKIFVLILYFGSWILFCIASNIANAL